MSNSTEQVINKQVFTVTSEHAGLRVDKFLAVMTQLSRTEIDLDFKSEKVLLNDELIKKNKKVKVGDIVQLEHEQKELLTSVVPNPNVKFEIVFENDELLVVNKPRGLVVHPSAGHYDDTLVNGLKAKYNDNLSDVNGEVRPGIVHRIDKDTSGLLFIAKTNEMHKYLQEELKEQKISRKYYALVHGLVQHNEGEIDAPIGRKLNDRVKFDVTSQNSKSAKTYFKVIERYKENLSLIECTLETGRTHQIRVHMQYIGHPIVADPLYGKKDNLSGGQMLHAKTLSYKDANGELHEFECQLDKYMLDYIKELTVLKFDN